VVVRRRSLAGRPRRATRRRSSRVSTLLLPVRTASPARRPARSRWTTPSPTTSWMRRRRSCARSKAMRRFEQQLEAAGVPYTPGRWPVQ